MAALLGCQQMGLAHSSIAGSRLQLRCTQPRVAPLFSQPIRAGAIGPGKKWEHYELTANGKPVRQSMHVKAGDVVQVITGADKGKVGKISKVVGKMGQVIVEGVNIKTKHNKPQREGEAGQITQKESPVHHSNVMHYSKEKEVRSRIGFKVNEAGVKVRYLKKTDEIID